MSSVTYVEDETKNHKEDESYFNDDPTGIPTGVVSAPTLLNNSYPNNSNLKNGHIFLPPVSFTCRH